MPDFAGRNVQCDMTVLTIAGTDQKALANEATLTVSADEIDTSAPLDGWKHRAVCTKDWTMSVGKLIASTTSFLDLVIAGASIVVSANLTGGEQWVGSALCTNASQVWANPQTESLTLVGNGATPTLT